MRTYNLPAMPPRSSCTMGVVFAFRKLACRLLPVVVVLWASLAMIGGGFHLAKEASQASQDTTVKAGLGLCAVSLALLAGRARQAVAQPVLARAPVPEPAAPASRAVVPLAHSLPPPGPPLQLLLRVSRT